MLQAPPLSPSSTLVARTRLLLEAPIVPTLLRLAIPNVLVMVVQAADQLTVHIKSEEEIFYPAAREAIENDDLMNEAVVEHNSAKELISQIQSMGPSDPMFDATVKVLGEYVNHHVEEEQNEIFPKVEKAKLDLEEIGAQIAQRKEELSEELMDE